MVLSENTIRPGGGKSYGLKNAPLGKYLLLIVNFRTLKALSFMERDSSTFSKRGFQFTV